MTVRYRPKAAVGVGQLTNRSRRSLLRAPIVAEEFQELVAPTVGVDTYYDYASLGNTLGRCLLRYYDLSLWLTA